MFKLFNKMRKKGKGFTLVELLVVVAIIAILAAVLMPKLLGYTERARQARALADLGSMKTIVEVYAADQGNGLYPDNSSVATVMQNNGIAWTGDDKGIKDPWGNPYYYDRTIDTTTNVTRYIIVSPGLDGNIGTADDVVTTDNLQPSIGAADTTAFPDLTATPPTAAVSYAAQ
ncbi:type II secretion system protein GspG [Moorella sp. E308F]|uniref:prepilin-type N-terminal cleavage/methylation domain-containing protein n=1 Tax=unclassified Neomoorella TaxID=2676739 RepID=UPI0010FFAE5A|nr:MULTISPECIES: prepilin-type N-terminal cleavage/methylation domain-containing protein [unclassified Moorella (in: firmicutes)]GEA15421.1 type II secretion system protein GspG [Moorella sp. E308F]GEA19719.1 type II secretion system protein GspG [Moorella sp. E306M]